MLLQTQVSIGVRCSEQILTPGVQGSIALSTGDIVGEIQSDVIPWSAVHFDSIKKWHSNCRTSHANCNQTLSKINTFDCEDVELPTRYLEISRGKDSASDQFLLQLALREGRGQRGSYVALSHRWTEASKDAMTNKENYLCRMGYCAHHRPCPTWGHGALTGLFGKASQLALDLGIDKIWIDSICIIQDDPEDWKSESVKMAQYYQYAWITISATQTTASGGLRSEFQPADIPRLARLPYRDRKGQQHGYFYLQALIQNAISEDYRDRVSNSDLMKRGWVFQERLLSRRTLSFSGTHWGVFMQCRDGEDPRTVTGDRVAIQAAPDIYKAFDEDPHLSWSSYEEVVLTWRRVVEAYSNLELGHIVEDRIVALSGIANEFGRMLHMLDSTANLIGQAENAITMCAYSSGIWLSDVSALLWERAEALTCSRINGIPTWSWASIKVQHLSSQGDRCPQGVKVQWPKQHQRFELVSSINCAVTLHVDSSNWLPVYTEPIQTREDSRYGNESRFSILKIQGKLLRVSIDSHFAAVEAKIAAKMTEHSLDFGRENWRSAATYSAPEHAAGWASVEHPELQEDAACRSAQNIVALFMTKKTSSQSWLGLGNILKRHVIFGVIYLRQVDNPVYTPCYERLGVGRLFEPEVEKLFKVAQEESIWLV
jgi:hypothetical protein